MPTLIKSEKAQTYVLYAILVLSSAFGNMSQTALNAMMPNIIAEMGINMSLGQWLTTIYMLVFGIVVPLATFLSKRFSTKNLVYLASGLSLVGLGMAVFSHEFILLFFGRVFQAAATGILLPLMQTTAMTRFSPNHRSTAMGVAGIAMGVAPTLGPTLGGLMDSSFGWRSFFILLAAVTVVLLVLTIVCVPTNKVPDKDARLETLSFILSSLGFGGLLLAFSDASNFALESPFVWLPLLLGVACLVAFVLRQKKVANPLIDMRIFSSKQYTNGFIAVNVMFAAHMGAMLILPLYVQHLCGGTSLDAGLTLLPGVFAALFVSPFAGYLTDKKGVRPVVVVGGLCFVVGSLFMVFVDQSTPLGMITVYQTIRSIGVSALVGPLTSWGLAGLPPMRMTDGSSFTLAVRQSVSSVATAAMVFVLTASEVNGVVPVIGYQLAFGFSALLALIAFLVIVLRVK